jgi:peptidoglycan hydrolase CwlO-like protein
MSTIDAYTASVSEMKNSLDSLQTKVVSVVVERDRLRAENARLQSEIQRLTLKLEQALHPQ